MSKTVKVKSKHGMSVIEGAGHAVAIACTAGLWYPVYRARKHGLDRTTTTYLPQPPQPVTVSDGKLVQAGPDRNPDSSLPWYRQPTLGAALGLRRHP
jgi:hypothetical protein